MRRRAEGSDQPASSKLALLHLDQGELVALERHEIDFVDGDLVSVAR